MVRGEGQTSYGTVISILKSKLQTKTSFLTHHLKQVSRTLRENEVHDSPNQRRESGNCQKHSPVVELIARHVEVVHGEDQPCHAPTEEPPKHPEDGLHAQVGTAIFVPDELG